MRIFITLMIFFSVLFLGLYLGTVTNASIELVYYLRLPRVILAAAVGAALTVSGIVLQALFTNPLCEPYTLGISSGAALGAVIGATFGLHWNPAGLAGASLIGALFFVGVLYLFSFRFVESKVSLLLIGVMLGFLGSSLVGLWMSISDYEGIQNAIFWLLGDLSRATLEGALLTLTVVIITSIFIFKDSRSLDALLLGEETAASLGISVKKLRRKQVLLTSLLVAICVSSAGMIGFIGLIVPHFVRRMCGSLHFTVIPIGCFWGAICLVSADILARILIRPYEIPVGVITALVGAPFFIWLMIFPLSHSRLK